MATRLRRTPLGAQAIERFIDENGLARDKLLCVGRAIMTNGAAYLGLHSRPGEFGHMCILPPGRECSCGRRGCLEAYCSTAEHLDSVNSWFTAMAVI